ncbi:TetR/AcrR family transcriptional regulator [Rhodococcus sp. HM1]|uniref:TetR/AcrR family transcriptional regulator n=1 Tax=Rhodococcus sp. HM1 TaxID=2937759 RepID=UPI00200AB2E1|nr:TetR/AcrR family transcriptional regulator [Rhodococcus sp. HM1]MCK8673459.1 TetR/AcrR family transcriptional regulator [Rhodococcus sp. HM1]
MVSKTSSPRVERRSRPKDRRDRIATAAAIAFAERGYHGVSVEDIAAEVGITKSALYRHFPGKYALFLNSALILLDALEAALEQSSDPLPGSAYDQLRAHLSAIIGTTITHRRTAGIYRWKRRYLQKEDRLPIRTRSWEVNRVIRECVMRIRPELSDRDAFVTVAAMLSVIGSITAHSLVLSPRRTEQLLLGACTAIAECDAGSSGTSVTVPAAVPEPAAVNNMREDLLRASVHLFHDRGYAEIGVEEIAAAVGLPASGVYRYYPSKADILAAAFYRAIDGLEAAVAEKLRTASDPVDAVRALTAVYVELSFSQRELMSVYFAELVHVAPGPRADLRLRQRSNIEQWAALLREVRPGLSVVESRFLMYGALNLVSDLGVFLGPAAAQQEAPRIHNLMMITLLGSNVPEE